MARIDRFTSTASCVGPLLGAASLALIALQGGCSGDAGPSEGSGEFLSHVPGQSGWGDGDPTAGESDGGDGDGDGDDASQAIAEADIIQLRGDQLFALSEYSGLSVVDVSDVRELELLGTHRSSARPFEMYLEGEMALVMYKGWASYEYDEGASSWQWAATSRIQALDVSDPAAIRVIGELDVPGDIIDSRKVGDIVYVATQENGDCWGCAATANSRVTSFDVSDASQFVPVDSLAFDTAEGWQRSISVSPERIYVSGWDWDRPSGGGTIDVVDITDPTGDLELGANIDIAGQVQSRWQMDEFEGTLRVISQPGGWGSTTPPVVETFDILSSASFDPQAALPMVLPRPEELKSVRFDGERAFAITFERTDPLFTFDLSDPGNPLQVGELEIPGWVHHMEPRGDRLFALGFDPDASEGNLHVSLFDVSDLADPTMMQRVNFGGDWGGFAEDQDRIHKAFNIDPDAGLILVPFFGEEYEEESCHYERTNGIQLVDFTQDSLELRGVAPQLGRARRAFLHEGSLLGVSDNAVQTFDVTDRDAPEKLDQIEIARNVSSLHVMGSTMLRFGSDWWSDQTVLDFARLSEVEQAEPLGQLDLSEFGAQYESSCSNFGEKYSYSWSYWQNQVFVYGSYAYLPRVTSSESDNGYSTEMTLYIVDLSNRLAPKLVGEFSLDPVTNGDYAGIIQTDGALLVGRSEGDYSYDPFEGERAEVEFFYDIIDLSNPLEPSVVERFEMPSQLARGGWGHGTMDCSIDMGWGWWSGYGSQNALSSGDLVVSQHEEAVKDGTGRVRYYLDRLDVSDPSSPRLLKKVNIPGTVVHYDHGSSRVVTIDYELEESRALDWHDCYQQSVRGAFDEDTKKCRVYKRRLNVLEVEGDVARLIERRKIDDDSFAGTVAISDNRVSYDVTTYVEEPGTSGSVERKLVSLAIEDDGTIEDLGETELSSIPYWYGQLLARGERAFILTQGEFDVVDTSDGTPKLQQHEMGGWRCRQLEVKDDTAYCAMGQYGVKSWDLN